MDNKQQMDIKQRWEAPQFEALTESGIRADQADIPVRNGVPSSPVPT